MFCNFCGKEVDEGTQTCPHCGADLKADTSATADPVKEEPVAEVAPAAAEPAPAPAPKPAPAPAAAPKPAPAPAPKPQAPVQQELKPNGMALAGFILAILSFVFTAAGPLLLLLGFIFSIVGLVRCKKGYNRKGFAIAGLIISTLSIGMAILFFAVLLPMVIGMLGELGGIFDSMAMLSIL